MNASAPAEQVAIIGGRVTGALSAARLAERGFEVTLLEKAAIGNGSSSRSLAGIRAQLASRSRSWACCSLSGGTPHFNDLHATLPDARQPVIRQNGSLFLYDHPDAPDAAPNAPSHWERAQAAAAIQLTREGQLVSLVAYRGDRRTQRQPGARSYRDPTTTGSDSSPRR